LIASQTPQRAQEKEEEKMKNTLKKNMLDFCTNEKN
jgi:hypothetical protein